MTTTMNTALLDRIDTVLDRLHVTGEDRKLMLTAFTSTDTAALSAAAAGGALPLKMSRSLVESSLLDSDEPDPAAAAVWGLIVGLQAAVPYRPEGDTR